MIWLLVAALVLVVCFGGVLLFGAPYLPSLTPQVHTALKMADLKPGQTLLELGCGDGKVLIAAARQGIKCVGYELNPLLFAVAWARTRRYRSQVRVIWGDFWQASWPPATAIFVFLLPKYMSRLDSKISKTTTKPIRLVSFAFAISDKKPAAVANGVFLYNYN